MSTLGKRGGVIMPYNIIGKDAVVPEDELRQAIKENIATFAATTVPTTFAQPIIKDTHQSDTGEKEGGGIDDNFELEITAIMQILNELSEEEFEAQIKDALPGPEHPEYLRYLRRIKLELQKSIIDIKALKKELGEDEELEAELLSNRNKLEILRALLEEPQIETEEQVAFQNNLIFVPAANGEPKILSDLAKIDQSDYKRILKMVLSISDGTFKNAKVLETGTNVSELRDIGSGARVLYARLDSNNYALIGALIKDSTSDKAYIDTLNNKIELYLNSKNGLLDNLNNPSFLAQQQEYMSVLFNTLSEEKDSKKYTKGGGKPCS